MLFVISTTIAAGLSGYYQIITPEESIRTAQKAELDQSLASLPSLLRPIGERLLAPTLFYCKEYLLDVSAIHFSLRCDENTPMVRPPDGSTSILPHEGKDLQSRVWWEGESVLISLASDTGTRTSRFTPEGEGLQLQVQVTSSRLDRPLSWQISYQRSP